MRDDTDSATTLRDVAEYIGLAAGCGDHACIWGPPKGMGTNGGCACLGDIRDRHARMTMRQLAAVADHLLKTRITMLKHGMHATLRIIERKKAYYELYRCDCVDRDPGTVVRVVAHRAGCKGEMMSTQPATFAILDEIKALIEAELGRI